MSAKNGDRSRFHRLRKQKLARRERRALLLKEVAAKLAQPPAAA